MLQFLEKHPKFYKIFLPITYLIDRYYMWKYWGLITNEMITNLEIFDWLNKNDFAYRESIRGDYLVKMDIIEPESFYDTKNSVELKVIIKKEFTKLLIDMFDKNISSDIENYINIFVDVDKMDNQRIFTIYLRYYRHAIISDYFKYFIIYYILLIFGLTGLLFMIL